MFYSGKSCRLFYSSLNLNCHFLRVPLMTFAANKIQRINVQVQEYALNKIIFDIILLHFVFVTSFLLDIDPRPDESFYARLVPFTKKKKKRLNLTIPLLSFTIPKLTEMLSYRCVPTTLIC